MGPKLAQWDGIFLKDARERLQGMIEGYELSVRDTKNMVSCRFKMVGR